MLLVTGVLTLSLSLSWAILCTYTYCAGVWASYDPSLGVVLLDTEGMLGLSLNENIRTRLLLKVQSLVSFQTIESKVSVESGMTDSGIRSRYLYRYCYIF
jgi:hypothetical protein